MKDPGFMKRHSDFMSALAIVCPLPKPYPNEVGLRYEWDNGKYIKALLKVEEGDLIMSLVEGTIGAVSLTKAELVECLLDTFGLTCPCCSEGRTATNLHHIIPRSRTSKKHPAWYLNDERNLLLVCVECDSPMLHTKAGIAKCIAIQGARHPEWDFTCEPWGVYL